MKKLLLTLLCLLTVSVAGFSKTLTITFDKDGLGNNGTAYVTTAWEFTVDGVKFMINQTNPSTGQIKMNQNPGYGFMLYNEVAMPGDITSISMVFSEADASKTPDNLYLNTDAAAPIADVKSEGTVTGAWDSATKTATWTVTEAGQKYFRFDCNRSTGGTNKVKTLTITYNVALLPADMSFMPATAEATVGELFNAPELVKATNAPVSYSSDNTAVATVDPSTGIVTPVSAGKAIITATAEANDTYEGGSASYTLTVKASPTGEDPIPDVPTTRKDAMMYFTPGILTVTYGTQFQTPQLSKATDAPIFFSSKNEAIAKPDPTTGDLTLTGAGTTMIYATAPANAEYLAGDAFYILTVERAAGKLTFSTDNVDVTLGDKFVAPTLAMEADGEITWISSIESVATVDANGNVTIVGAGTTTITASAAQGALYTSATASYTITVTDPLPDGTVEVLMSDWGSEGFTAATAWTKGNFVFTADKSAGGTAPAYNAASGAVRIYADGTLNIKTVDGANLTNIIFKLAGDAAQRYTTFTPNEGSVATQAVGDTKIEWTGNANDVTFTVGKNADLGTENTKAGQIRIEAIILTTGEGGDTPGPDDPTPATGSYTVFDIDNPGTWTTQGTGFTNTKEVNGVSFTITTDKASSTTTLISPAANTNSWRVYKGSNFTLSAAGIDMKKVIITFDDYSSYNYAKEMTLSTGWTGSLDQAVYTITGSGNTLTATASDAQVRIKKIVVETGEGGDTPGPDDPTPADSYATLADFMAAKPATNVTLNADLTAVYQNGKDLFVTSGGAYALVYGELSNTYNNGDVIKAPVEGKYDEYNAVPEFIPVASTFAAGEAGTAVAAQAVEISSLTTADFGKYIRLEGVTIEASADNDRSFTATDGAANVTVWNRWNKSVTVNTGTDATIYGFIGINKPAEGDAVVNIWPVRVEVEGGDTPVNPGTGSYTVFDIANPGTWTAQGTGFTRTNTVDGETFTITTDQASSTTALISPAANSYAWRVYKGSNFTLSAADLNMKKIIITYDDYTTDGKGYAFEMALSAGWTGSLNGTVYTITGSGNSITATADINQVRIKTIVVESGEGGEPVDPTPSTESVTFDFTQPSTLTPAQDMPAANAPVVVNGVKFTNGPISCVTVNTGTQESRDPRLYFYKEASEFRFYEDNTTTISGEGVTIEKIEFLCQYPSNFADSSADCGTFENAVWTGEAQNVVFSWHKSGDYSPKTNQIRVTYTKGAGIDNLDADYSDAPVEYYNLQGVRIANPAPGMIVIRRQGNQVSKVLVK